MWMPKFLLAFLIGNVVCSASDNVDPDSNSWKSKINERAQTVSEVAREDLHDTGKNFLHFGAFTENGITLEILCAS